MNNNTGAQASACLHKSVKLWKRILMTHGIILPAGAASIAGWISIKATTAISPEILLAE